VIREVPCAFCGIAVDPLARTTYQKVEGWVRPRTQGGVNALANRKLIDEFACWTGNYRQTKGVSPDQLVIE
jgi:hypothetical protein